MVGVSACTPYALVAGAPTPTAARFDELSHLWDGLGDGGELRLEWPTLRLLSRTG